MGLKLVGFIWLAAVRAIPAMCRLTLPASLAIALRIACFWGWGVFTSITCVVRLCARLSAWFAAPTLATCVPIVLSAARPLTDFLPVKASVKPTTDSAM